MSFEPLELKDLDYWDANTGEEKIKTDGLKQHTGSKVITH